MPVRLSGLLAVALLPLVVAPALAAEPPSELQISSEVRILQVPAGFRERLGIKCDAGQTLNEREMRLLIEAAQGQPHANVMQFPKLTTLDGQSATVRVGDQKFYMVGVEAKCENGKFDLAPCMKAVDLGHTIKLCGTVSADQKFVKLHANVTHASEVAQPAYLPLDGFTVPRVEGGYNQGPIAYSRRLEVPCIKTAAVEKTATVPTGGTVVLGGWKESGVASDSGPPMFSRIPYINRLFKNSKVIECDVIVLATTRVVPCDAGKCESKANPADLPGWPERYNHATRQAVIAPFAQQVTNGHVARQTICSSDFEPGTPNLTKAGAEKLKAIATARPRPDTTVYLQPAHDFPRVPECGVWLNEWSAFMTRERSRVVGEHLRACAGGEVAFKVLVIEPPMPQAAVAPPAPVAPPACCAEVHKLRHVAAADVAEALNKRIGGRQQGIMAVAEPVSNTVVLTGEVALVRQASRVVAELDVAPQQTMIQAQVMEVPHEWLADIGLKQEAGKALVLSERELAMFQAAIRREKEKGGIDILSRPQMQVADGQTARVQIGQMGMIAAGLEMVQTAQGGLTVVRKVVPEETGMRLAVTPRMEPKDGTMMLRVEAQFSWVIPGAIKVPLTLPPDVTGLKETVTYQVGAHDAVNTQAVQMTVAGVRDGQTVILSGGVRKEKRMILTAGGERKEDGEIARETLIILTPHRVKGDAVRPAGGVMPAPPPTMPAPHFVPAPAPCPAILPAPAVAPPVAPQDWFLPTPGASPQPRPPALPAPIPGPLPNGGILPATPAAQPAKPAVLGLPVPQPMPANPATTGFTGPMFIW